MSFMKYGYGQKPDGRHGHCWYPVAFDSRSEAHKECIEELSYCSRHLYTQGHVTIFGFTFKVWFTYKAVEWSKKLADLGNQMIMRAIVGRPDIICHYNDCGNGRPQVDDDEIATCEYCREDLGVI
jgi:hypothetical protein